MRGYVVQFFLLISISFRRCPQPIRYKCHIRTEQVLIIKNEALEYNSRTLFTFLIYLMAPNLLLTPVRQQKIRNYDGPNNLDSIANPMKDWRSGVSHAKLVLVGNETDHVCAF